MKASTRSSHDKCSRISRPKKRNHRDGNWRMSARDLYRLDSSECKVCFAGLTHIDGTTAQMLFRHPGELRPCSSPGDNARDVREGHAVPQFTFMSV